MNKVFEQISNNASKAGFAIRRHSPDIMVFGGIISVIAGAILACRATLKAKPVIDDHKETVKSIKDIYEEEKDSGSYPEKAKNKDIARTYFKTGAKITKLYAPSVIFGTLGIASILGSHKILTDRNMATAAAYTALSETLRKYRDRVSDKLGVEEEKELWIKPTREELLKDAEECKPNEEEKRKKRNKKNLYGYSNYARIFDAAYPGWDDNPEFTKYHLMAVQSVANQTLESKGHLFLNEVYDMLGFERTAAGWQVGWIYDPTVVGKISFGIYNLHDPQNARFHDGTEQNIILDFNVDGVITNILPKY